MRKGFEPALYAQGEAAELHVLNVFSKLGHDLIDGLTEGSYIVCRNSNKYGVDLLILTKNSDKSYTEFCGIEVVRRSNITYNTIFLEGNKIKYFQTGLPIYFIVVNDDLTQALVLDSNKDVTSYSQRTTNFNSEGKNEVNVVIPRSEFIEWDFK